MKRANALSAAFVVIVWSTLILLAGFNIYKKFLNESQENSLGFNIKSMKDLLNGSP